MAQKAHVDLAAGLALTVLGVGVAVYSATRHSLGTGTQLGSGSFPLAVGVILGILGLIIGGKAIAAEADVIQIHWRPMAAVTLAIAVFAIALQRVGLFPAVLLLTIISSFAGKVPFRPMNTLLYGIALSVSADLLFRVGLGIPLVPLRWPF